MKLRDDRELRAEIRALVDENTGPSVDEAVDAIFDAIDRRTPAAPPEPRLEIPHAAPTMREFSRGVGEMQRRWLAELGRHYKPPEEPPAATPGTAPTPPCPCGDWAPGGPSRPGHPEGWCADGKRRAGTPRGDK